MAEPDPTEATAAAADARLLRDVRRRLVAFSGLSTFLVLVVLGVALYATAASALRASGVAQLDERATVLRRVIERGSGGGGNGGPGERPPVDFTFGGGASGTLAVVVSPAGVVFGPRQLDLPTSIPDHDAITAAAGSGRDLRDATIGSVPIRMLTVSATSPDGTWWIQVFQDRSAEARTLENLLLVLLVGGLVVVIVAVGFGTVYARRALVPIRESLVAQRTALRRQREFAADASHELRTPLTVIRSSVEYLRRPSRGGPREADERAGALEDIEAEVEHLTVLVEDLLLLARSDSGAVTLEREPVALEDVTTDAVARLAGMAAGRGVRVAVDPAPARVTGDPTRLRQLVTILVDNAIRHSPRDAEVRVGVGPADAATVRLTVDDAGPGVRPEDREHVFERFWRAPGAPAGGTGLGLAIARWIVERHGGTIAVTDSPLGGARFETRLPERAGTDEAPAPATPSASSLEA